MATIIQLRRDTAANWTANNPILADGEPAFETDTRKEKIGDGVTAWNDLPYKSEESSSGSGSVISGITILNGNHILTTEDKDKILRVKEYSVIEVPTGLGLRFRTVIKRKTIKTVSFIGAENVVLEIPENFYAEFHSENDYVELILEEISEGIEYWGVAGALAPVNTNFPVVQGAKVVLTPDQTSVSSLYFTRIYKSSDWPEIPIDQPYFTIYSSIHDNGGGIYWGGMDDPEFGGFVELGQIVSGYQAETPFLIRGGAPGEPIHLYYHTLNEPGHTLSQETRLITTSGGLLHEAVWTDRGRPVIPEADWSHTGYAQFRDRGDGTIVASHNTKSGVVEYAISHSTDGGLTFNFVKMIDNTAATMPAGTTSGHAIAWEIFSIGGVDYGFSFHDNGEKNVAIYEIDSDFLPTALVEIVYAFPNMSSPMAYIENGIAYLIMVKDSEVNEPVYLHKYKIKSSY